MKDDFSNIFEAAGKMRPKRPTPRKAAAETPAPAGQEPPPAPQSPRSKPLTEEEVKNMLEHMHKLKDEMSGKIKGLYASSGLAPKVVREYLEKLGGITTQEWKNSRAEIRELKEKVWSVIGPEARTLHEKKEKERTKTQAKKRKGKTVGGRRRWIRVE